MRTTYPRSCIRSIPLTPGVSMVTCNSDCNRGLCFSEINAPCSDKSFTIVSSSNACPPSVTPHTRARKCASLRSAVRLPGMCASTRSPGAPSVITMPSLAAKTESNSSRACFKIVSTMRSVESGS